MTEQTLSYATPSPRPAARLAPAVWIAIVGLALIGFGGCFLIGIMMNVSSGFIPGNNPPASMTPRLVIFLIVMYAATLGCFGGALLLVGKGVRALFAML
ncbi:MAG TPA: hypothetical protein VFE47_11115 [Tepidisphaeraceae bacterium]|nr:hypothetical protein [Tepidisphaeraceae bacterium]